MTKQTFSDKEAILNRAEEIVRHLNLTRENVELFEDCERISFDVVSYSSPSSEGGEILEISRWVHRLHESLYKNILQKYLEAARDVFSRLPVKGDIREAITTYHQLEQLVREIGDEELSSITDCGVREALKAVMTVHDNNQIKKAKLRERYGLS